MMKMAQALRRVAAALLLILSAGQMSLAQVPAQTQAQAQAQAPATAASSPLPAELFYRPPAIERALLSPSGRWLAMTSGVGSQRTALVVFDTEAWKVDAVAARFADADIGNFYWVNDERLVFDILDRERGSGDQRWWPGLFSVKRDGSEMRNLVKLSHPFITETPRPGVQPLRYNHELLHVPVGGGDEVIVGEWRFGGAGEIQGVNALRLNVVTGRSQSLSMGVPDNVRGWLFSPDGEPRVAVTRKGARVVVHWRGPAQTNWRQITESDLYDRRFTPRFVDPKGNLYVTVHDASLGTSVLTRFDFATGKPEPQALVRTPGFDFWGGIVSETTGSRALGVRVTTDAQTTHWFDARLAALQKQVDQRWPGLVNRLNCRRCDESNMTVLMRSSSDRNPGQWWLHTAADGQWRMVGEERPGLVAQQMGSTDFERIKARDGQELPLWITKPAGASKAPLPAVVLVHGGPWVRGRQWEWKADAQFLASRGYVVIEPEFRGSRGYGLQHFRAGWGQWGRAMQDDVADALAWAVKQGHVDPKRVCIAGASYGGYATLMGLARHPELYRCGVAWVAVTDPRLMFTWRYGTDQSDEVREVDYPLLIGDPVKDAALLDSVTPVLLADKITAPLMLAVGGSDRRVLPVHGQRMRQALTDAGRPPQWVVYDDEGHGWLKLETRLDFAQRLESFLAQHLKPVP